MASRARQSLLVIQRAKKEENTGKMLWISARTGLVDVTINGQRFYYNEKQTYNSLAEVNIPKIMQQVNNSNKKGIIIITRKKG